MLLLIYEKRKVMYQEQRLQKILELLDRQGQLSSKEAIDLLAVSRDTIRRDFALLTERKQVLRTHGGILPLQKSQTILSFEERLNNLMKEKNEIAQKAYQLIVEGQLYFLMFRHLFSSWLSLLIETLRFIHILWIMLWSWLSMKPLTFIC